MFSGLSNHRPTLSHGVSVVIGVRRRGERRKLGNDGCCFDLSARCFDFLGHRFDLSDFSDFRRRKIMRHSGHFIGPGDGGVGERTGSMNQDNGWQAGVYG